MKKYENMSQPQNREQVVEVTLQSGEYKGSFQLNSLGGNCLGLDILTSNSFDDDYCFEKLRQNNIKLSISDDDEGELWIKYYLKDNKGNICEYEQEIRDFTNNIIKLEIVECKVVE